MLQQLYKALARGRPLGVAMNLVVGFVAEICCVFVVVPLELMSMQQSEGESLGSVVRKTWNKSGIGGFYQGWTGYIMGGVMHAKPAQPTHVYDPHGQSMGAVAAKPLYRIFVDSGPCTL